MRVILLDDYKFYLVENDENQEHYDKDIMGIETSIVYLEKMISRELPKNLRCVMYLDRDRYIKFLNNNLEYDGFKVIIYDMEEFDLDEDDLNYFK
jgi:hypothetical protein